MEKLKELFQKYREMILYVFFGGLTTLVNIVSYYLFADVVGGMLLHEKSMAWILVSNVFAWVLSVLFAYITNRIYVFQSGDHSVRGIAREFALFVGCRLVSGFFDTAAMFVMIDWMHIQDLLAKILTNVVVVILNYIFSKLIIFRKKSGEIQ